MYPILSVEVDGNLLPPNIVNKLNIFMVNVLRFRDGGMFPRWLMRRIPR